MRFKLPTIRALALAMLACALTASSCGYTMVGRETPTVLKEEYRKLCIILVENPSLEYDLEPSIRSKFRDELTKRGGVTWVDRPEATGWVTLEIQRFDLSGWVKGYQDKTLKYEASIWVSARIQSAASGKVIWDSGGVNVSRSYLKGQEKETQEIVTELAVRRLADRMIENY